MNDEQMKQNLDDYFERMAADLRSMGLAMPDDMVELPSGRTVRAADAEAALRADMAKKSPAQQILHMTARLLRSQK
jgi:hypothetical protein